MIILFNDDVIEYIEKNKADIAESIKEDDRYPTAEAIEEEAYSWIKTDWDYLRDDVATFDEVSQYTKIIIEGDLGLWYGRRKIVAKCDTLFEALTKAMEDYNTLFFKNKNATLQLKAIHHDGVNYFKFYKVIKGKKYAIKYNDIYRG